MTAGVLLPEADAELGAVLTFWGVEAGGEGAIWEACAGAWIVGAGGVDSGRYFLRTARRFSGC